MQRIAKRLSLVLISICLFASAAHALHIVIDPGHGGADTGAVANHLIESKLTLQISELLAAELSKDTQFTFTLTRSSDVFITLEERASIANTKGDVFISIHANSSTDPRARGKEIYFQNQLPSDEEALFLASRENADSKVATVVERATLPILKNKRSVNADVRSIVEDLNRNYALQLSGLLTEKLFHNWNGERVEKHKAVRQAPFFVISNTDRPAVLLEVGYLTNPSEAKLLADPAYLKKIAQGIHRALISFKELIDKPTTKELTSF